MSKLKRLQEKGRSRKKEIIRPVRLSFRTSRATAKKVKQLEKELGSNQSLVLDAIVLIGLGRARKQGYLTGGE